MNKTEIEILSRVLPNRYDANRTTGEATIGQSPRIDAALKSLAEAGILEYEPSLRCGEQVFAWRFRLNAWSAAMQQHGHWGKCQELS